MIETSDSYIGSPSLADTPGEQPRVSRLGRVGSVPPHFRLRGPLSDSSIIARALLWLSESEVAVSVDRQLPGCSLARLGQIRRSPLHKGECRMLPMRASDVRVVYKKTCILANNPHQYLPLLHTHTPIPPLHSHIISSCSPLRSSLSSPLRSSRLPVR